MRKMTAKKILVADPECGPGSPLIHLLESNDFKVMRARSVNEAWKILTTEHPNLLLMEPMMPVGTEGFHLVWRLRDYPDRQLSRVPIILLSRIHHTIRLDLFPDIRDGHYHANEFLPVQAFLNKPFDERALLETIDDVLWRQAS
jgi:CheY-like chemotaxis protein